MTRARGKPLAPASPNPSAASLGLAPWAVAAAACLVSACARPQDPGALGPDPRATQAGAAQQKPFYVVAEGATERGSEEVPLGACRLGQTTFLCGTSLAFVNGAFTDVAAPIPRRSVVGGNWPEAAWSIQSVDQARKLMRWDPPLRRWKEEAELKPPPSADPSLTKTLVGTWTKGRALVVDYVSAVTLCDQRPTECVQFASYGEGVAPLPPRFVQHGKPVLDFVLDAAIFDTGDLFMVGWKGKVETFVARWRISSVLPSVERLGDGRCHPAKLVGTAPSNLVAVGRTSEQLGSRTACGFRFTRGRWVPLELPGWGSEALSYAEEPGGTEWVLLREVTELKGAQKSWEAKLWSRARKGTWVEVALPVPSPKLRGWGGQLAKAHLWAAGDGDVWLQTDYRDGCGMQAHAVLHNAQPKDVCRLWGTATRCVAPSEYQPDQWAWSCESPGKG